MDTWGWAGNALELVAAPAADVLSSLSTRHQTLTGQRPSASQSDVWAEELDILATALESCQERAGIRTWSVILEYELPLEGGRRPDAVILAGRSVVVLEFKRASVATQAGIDQTEAYARDLAEYHAVTHGLQVIPAMVLTRTNNVNADFDPVALLAPDQLADAMPEFASDGHIDLASWVQSPYAPLPTLVTAARHIFSHHELPHVRAAIAQDIPGTLEAIGAVVDQADTDKTRHLVLVGGVPGSGKTLVGLRLVYEQLVGPSQRTVFLSGNGPLVQVLRDALKSGVFVKDLHRFIKEFGIDGKAPSHHVVVFDEAQRAWDRGFMSYKRQISRSEPELLVDIGNRVPDWCVLVGLVGDGQEIFSGEEGGLGQWRDALVAAGSDRWQVHAPEYMTDQFAGLSLLTNDRLRLRLDLRSRRADLLHEWVRHLLEGSLELAKRLSPKISGPEGLYPMYVTRTLDDARAYARARYGSDLAARYGLLAPSHAKAPRRNGVDTHFKSVQSTRLGPWFNAPSDDPSSCCALSKPLTEFQVQGLELDLPIVCWGEDYIWHSDRWVLKPARSQYPQEDSRQLLKNAYRVLLTRGRDGLVVFLPPEPAFDQTQAALLEAGMATLRLEVDPGGLGSKHLIGEDAPNGTGLPRTSP
jgi:DUF2075 family protein